MNELTEAKDPTTTPERLDELAKETDLKILMSSFRPSRERPLSEVRRAVAQNPNASKEALLSLLDDFPSEVVQNHSLGLYLLEDPAMLQKLHENTALILASTKETPASILGLLLNQSWRKVNLQIARHQNLSTALMRQMLEERLEIPNLLENSSFSEELWLWLAEKEFDRGPYRDPYRTTQLLLSRSPRLPQSARLSLEKIQDQQIQQSLRWRDEAPQDKPAPDVKSCGATEKGPEKSRNEDNIAVYQGASLSLFVVLDGMGGHSGGEYAARLAKERLEECAKKADGSPCPANGVSCLIDGSRERMRAVGFGWLSQRFTWGFKISATAVLTKRPEPVEWCVSQYGSCERSELFNR